MRFQEMDPEDVRRLLEEKDEKGNPLHQDVLAPLVRKEEALFRNSTCPVCGTSGTSPFIDPSRPFLPGSALPNRLLRCTACSAEFDPFTRMITRINPVAG
jgi:hypothetical protein